MSERDSDKQAVDKTSWLFVSAFTRHEDDHHLRLRRSTVPATQEEVISLILSKESGAIEYGRHHFRLQPREMAESLEGASGWGTEGGSGENHGEYENRFPRRECEIVIPENALVVFPAKGLPDRLLTRSHCLRSRDDRAVEDLRNQYVQLRRHHFRKERCR